MRSESESLQERRKQGIIALLKGIETGDPKSVSVLHPERYIQHNPQTLDNGAGLIELFKRLSKTSPHVNIVRIFSDGDFVFAHTEYDFSSRRIGFEVFRFEGEYAVEHWDNIQPRQGPNEAGHNMVDGSTRIEDKPLTEANRTVVKHFIERVLIKTNETQLGDYVHLETFVDHHPEALVSQRPFASVLTPKGSNATRYTRLHRVLAQGNYALSVCEGYLGNQHTAFYNLFRISADRIIERWNTTEKVPVQAEWKNDNGKF